MQMRPFSKRRRRDDVLNSVHHEDPLGGVANLFDASIVFAIGLMVALVQVFSMTQLLSPHTEFTIVARNSQTGQMEFIEKSSKQIKVKKVSEQQKAGAGARLGIAYQLPDGSVVYVPEGKP